MARNKIQNWRKVESLPQSALKVADYAKQWPCNTSYLYKLARERKNLSRFEIIEFQGINFILPQ